jgi:hypothetical protein
LQVHEYDFDTELYLNLLQLAETFWKEVQHLKEGA